MGLPAVANKRLIAAQAEHQKWLRKRGLTREQLGYKRVKSVINRIPDYKVEENLPLSNGFAKTPGKTTMMELRYKESPSVRAEIEKKAMRIAPAYNKGNAQYVSDGDSPKYLGKKI